MGQSDADDGTRIGLMLYTVRAESARDFAGTLRRIGEMGYAGVELFDLHGHRPTEVRALLDASGLVACSRHARLEQIELGLGALAEEAHEIGWRRLVVSWIDPAELGDPEIVPRLRQAAAGAAKAGLELGFHNHDAELRKLASGRTFLEELPEEMFLELDLGWAWYAGADVLALLREAEGRCPLVHVKDFQGRDRPPRYCPVGDGDVGYPTVAPAAVERGVEWLLVEQDETDGPALAAAQRSFEALRSMLQAPR